MAGAITDTARAAGLPLAIVTNTAGGGAACGARLVLVRDHFVAWSGDHAAEPDASSPAPSASAEHVSDGRRRAAPG